MQEVALRSWQSVLSGRKLDSSRCAIESVTDNGMFDRAQVYPDLMRSARLDRELEERETAKGFHHFVQRMRLTSMGGSRRHAQAVNAIATDGALDFSTSLLHLAVHERQIPFDDHT